MPDAATLNILTVGAFPFPSLQGSQVYAGGLARALAAAGHRVWLAAYGYGEGAWPEGVERVPVGRLPVGHLGSGPQWAKLPWDGLLLAGLVRLLRQERIDVIHAHHVEAPFLVRAALALAGKDVPLVWTPHTNLAEELPVYFDERWATWMARLGSRLDGVTSHLPDHVVCLSRRSQDQMDALGARGTTLVHPGVDPEEFPAIDARAARVRHDLQGRPWVAYAGNLDAYQELDRLMEAVARTDELGLVVATHGDPERAHAMADVAGLPQDRRRFVRCDDFEQVCELVSGARLAAIPRRTCAGFPMKLLNMLMCGVPVVVPASIAQPIEGVITVGSDDIDALAGVLLSHASHQDLCEGLGRSGRAAVLARWTWSSRVSDLQAAYEQAALQDAP